MKNQDIRQAVSEAGLKLWQVAEGLGIGDTAFSKKLRREFDPTQKERVMEIIAMLKKGEE